MEAGQDGEQAEDVVDTIGEVAAMVSEMKLTKASCFA
jgi:hypothetical protein